MKTVRDSQYGAIEMTDDNGYRLWFNPGTWLTHPDGSPAPSKTVLRGKGPIARDEVYKTHRVLPKNWFTVLC